VPRIRRYLGWPQVSPRTLYRRVRLVAIWRRPKLTARGDPDHDHVVAGIVARLLELPRRSVVLAEDETHLNLLPHVRASWTLRGARPQVLTPSSADALARRATGQSHRRPSDPRNRTIGNVQGSMTVPAPDNLGIAVIATGGAEEPELAEPVRALRQAGTRTELPSIKPGQIQPVRHDLPPAQTFAVGKRLDRADPEGYDALLLPGGAVNAGRLHTEPAVRSVLKQIIRAGKPVTVICHAAWGPVPSGAARGRTVTSYQTIQDDLLNAGGTWVDREMVVHGNLVTRRQPATSLPSLARCSTFSLRLEERWKLSLR
jgi:protease I